MTHTDKNVVAKGKLIQKVKYTMYPWSLHANLFMGASVPLLWIYGGPTAVHGSQLHSKGCHNCTQKDAPRTIIMYYLKGNLRKNVKFQFFGDRMQFGVSKKMMRPYVTLLNIFSEIALKKQILTKLRGGILHRPNYGTVIFSFIERLLCLSFFYSQWLICSSQRTNSWLFRLRRFNPRTVSKITYVNRFLGSVWTPMLIWTSDPWIRNLFGNWCYIT